MSFPKQTTAETKEKGKKKEGGKKKREKTPLIL